MPRPTSSFAPNYDSYLPAPSCLSAVNLQLAQFSEGVQAYRANNQSLSEHRSFLFAGSPRVPAMVSSFQKTVRYEQSPDFDVVQKKWNKAVAELVKHLRQDEVMEFLLEAGSARLGAVTQSAFIKTLHALLLQHRVALTPFPAMSAYIDNVLCSGAIVSGELLGIVWVAQRAGHLARCTSDEERFLGLELDRIHLIERLFDFLDGGLKISQIRGNTVTDPTANDRLRAAVQSKLSPLLTGWREKRGMILDTGLNGGENPQLVVYGRLLRKACRGPKQPPSH